MPLERLSGSAPDASRTTDTLDSRVRRLEQILAATGGWRGGASGGGESVDAETAALQRLSSIAPRLKELTREIQARVGAGCWDAADILGARVLLEELAAALRSSRLVANRTAARLHEVQNAVKDARRLLNREIARSQKDVQSSTPPDDAVSGS